MANSLDVKVTADVVDLQTKMAVAKAEVQSYASEMRKLAQQSAQGVLDPAGQAQLQQVAEDFLHAKAEASELSSQMKELRETSGGVGEALEDIRGKMASAFQFTGIAAAVEIVHEIGEKISELGERATQIHAMSELLGVTVEQFQAMQQAAEEGGTGIETFVRASEQLLNMFTEARSGSSAAADKLLNLGFAIGQIRDPAFKLNDALGVLNQRLTDGATEEDTRAQLMKELGLRTAQAAQAFIHYSGTQEDVAEKNKQVSALNKIQTEQLHEAGLQWKDLGEKAENNSSKILLWLGKIGQSIQENLRGFRQLGEAIGAPQGGSAATPGVARGTIDRGPDQREAAEQQKQLDREMAQQKLQNIKAGIEAYKEGTAERLAQLKLYAAAAQQYYQSSEVDSVQKANEQVISETRRVSEERKRIVQDLADYSSSLYTRVTADDARGKAELAALDIKMATDEKKILDDMSDYAQELDTRVTKDHAKVLQERRRIEQQAAQDVMQQWEFLKSGLSQGFGQALQGILSGTESFGEAMRGLFTSVLDSIIGKLADWAAEWITKLLLAKFTNQAAAASQISANAGIAATAAMASVAAIPFVGWAMAPGVGAATFGEAMAYEGATAVAEGGWDVPASSKAMPALLHSREMVLPANLAEGVRSMVGQNGGQTGPRPGGTVNVKFTPTGGGYGLVHMGNLASALKQLNNRFALG